MNNNISSRLTFRQRCKIEEMVNKIHRKFEIANELDKSPSTFNDNNSIASSLLIVKFALVSVISFSLSLDRTIGACNNCSKLHSCKLDKFFCIADSAQKDYEYTLVDSRLGVNLTKKSIS